jgi:hypothetical protein
MKLPSRSPNRASETSHEPMALYDFANTIFSFAAAEAREQSHAGPSLRG